MNNSPAWSLLLSPYTRLLTRGPAIFFWAMIALAVVMFAGIMCFDQRQPFYLCLFVVSLCGIWHQITQTLCFFSSTFTWDLLPGVRRAMSNFLVAGTSILGLITLACISWIFLLAQQPTDTPSDLNFFQLIFVLMWGALAREGVIQIVQATRKQHWRSLHQKLFTAALIFSAFCMFMDLHPCLYLNTFFFFAASIAVTLRGTWLIRHTHHRIVQPVPPVLVGVMRGQPYVHAPSSSRPNVGPSWAIRAYNIASELAAAKRRHNRLWFVDLLSPTYFATRVTAWALMGLIAGAQMKWTPLTSDVLTTPKYIFTCMLVSYTLMLASKAQPWLFLASLPVSRRQLARDLTLNAMRVALLDIIVLTFLATGITWVLLPYIQPVPLPANLPPQVLTALAASPKPRTHIPAWDVFTFASIAAIAVALARLFIVAETPQYAKNLKRILLPSLLLGLTTMPLLLLCNWLKGISNPPSITAWIVLPVIVSLVWAWSFWLYYNYWLTAEFHDRGILFSFKKSFSSALDLPKSNITNAP
jgi:hypothetical protein